MTRRTCIATAAGMVLPGTFSRLSAADTTGAAGKNQVRFVSSLSLIGEVNPSDANAAVISWRVEIEKLGDLQLTFDAPALYSPERLAQMIRTGAVDGFAVTSPEYFGVADYVDRNTVLIDDIYAGGGEEYVILSSVQSVVGSLNDLRGRDLLVFNNPTTCLAANWLDVLLDSALPGGAARFLGMVSLVPKLSRSVLPVYFGQRDACLVTRRGFRTMCEMNPDLNRQLRVLAVSPKVIPVCLAFHKNCPPARKAAFIAAMGRLPKAPGGKQLLSLFQSHGVVVSNASVLHSAGELVRAAEKIRSRSARSSG
ncbi:MAG: PhnD/SsuA/transferrin family substrate-binding protein [Acidobacteria bacterium]|nr:PhnD/SsuA/transferrin family substrate-binding protein [Acidobacteriota bacterium]